MLRLSTWSILDVRLCSILNSLMEVVVERNKRFWSILSHHMFSEFFFINTSHLPFVNAKFIIIIAQSQRDDIRISRLSLIRALSRLVTLGRCVRTQWYLVYKNIYVWRYTLSWHGPIVSWILEGRTILGILRSTWLLLLKISFCEMLGTKGIRRHTWRIRLDCVIQKAR